MSSATRIRVSVSQFHTAHFTGRVQFWVLLGDQPVFVQAACVQDSLVKFFTSLQNDANAAGYIPAKIAYHACEFYRLNTPVQIVDDEDGDEDTADRKSVPDEVIQACLEKANRVCVNPLRTRVQRLAKEFSPDHLYLAITLPDGRCYDF